MRNLLIRFYTHVHSLCFRAFFIVFTLLTMSSAWAWPPTYGAEFEFTRQGLNSQTSEELKSPNSPEKLEQMKFVSRMRERCASSNCKVIEVNGKWNQDYKVLYPDGWWFKISYDPTCLEVTFKPSTLSELTEKASLINDHIFNTAKEIGLNVRRNDNTHFNMGVRSAFKDDAKKFLRFFIDYANHPDLALGSLGLDLNNGPPLSVLGPNQREALTKIIEESDAGKLVSITDVAWAIQHRVYTKSYNDSWGATEHYQAVGLKYVVKTNLAKDDAPMELRAVWAQESAEKFNLVAKLIEGRIKYLNTLSTPIVYSALARDSFSYTELRTRFAIYVEEAGLKYNDFIKLLPKAVQSAPLDDFMRTDVSVEKRLKRIEAYWDLASSSALVQKNILDILYSSKLANHPKSLSLIERIKNEKIPELAKFPRVGMCKLLFN